MFNTVSMTSVGGLITVAIVVLKFFGVELPEGMEAKITEAVATIIGVVLLVWGQLRRKDLIAGVVRR